MPGPDMADDGISRAADRQHDEDMTQRARLEKSTSEEQLGTVEGAATKQLLSPHPTPPPPNDPFPAFDLTTATPVTAEDPGHEGANDAVEQTAEDGDGQSRAVPLSREGSSHNHDDASSPSATDAADVSHSKEAAEVHIPKPRTQSASKKEGHDIIRKLSASQMQALTASPDSLPVAVVPSHTSPQRKPNGNEYPMSASAVEPKPGMAAQLHNGMHTSTDAKTMTMPLPAKPLAKSPRPHTAADASAFTPRGQADLRRPPPASRTLSTPSGNHKASSSATSHMATASARRNSYNLNPRPPPLNLGGSSNLASVPQKAPLQDADDNGPQSDSTDSPPPPIHHSIPLPPMSLHTHLQLELAGVRPSPLYIYRHQTADFPYESSAVKFERLLNALWLPWYLEWTLTFGALACLDAFLYTFTLLPMRFCIAIGVLIQWWSSIFWKECKFLVGYVWSGVWRVWKRGRRGRAESRSLQGNADSSGASSDKDRHNNPARESGYAPDAPETFTSDRLHRPSSNGTLPPPKHAMPRNMSTNFRHRRSRSMPSNLTSYNKADLLQGAVIICSSLALMNIDASRMYHFIRAQSAMKLYVIYNLLEVGDRLLGAIGQDILECLFSAETLSRNSSGRSKLLLPFGMFILSLIYNVIHAICLFYQVITLNVAVNSYSNALLSLLMSNQFVEIKGSVFKKIEKENLFQLTCSDVVERFQLWIILIIIAMRNIVEVGGLSVPGAGSEPDGGGSGPGPLHTASILPASFKLLPSWMMSGEVLSPFLIVVGSEMLVDWIKHAYINKFNNVKPIIYRRMLDIFCKDYYTNAFGAPALTRRIGLPLLPLSCLFIRASVQIYNMFLSTRLPPPVPPTATKDVSLESSSPSSSSPAMMAALDHLDSLIRNALGRSVYGYPYANPHVRPFWAFTSDDAIAMVTMLIIFFLTWVVLLMVKLLLGMVLLKYARERYVAVRTQELAGQPKQQHQQQHPPEKQSSSSSHHGQQHQQQHKQQQQQNQPQKKESNNNSSSSSGGNSYYQPGKRVGGWGHIEVGDERRRMVYADDAEGLRRMRERERKGEEAARTRMVAGEDGLEKVARYEMIAKRIW